jgi:hypothetical protein
MDQLADGGINERAYYLYIWDYFTDLEHLVPLKAALILQWTQQVGCGCRYRYV